MLGCRPTPMRIALLYPPPWKIAAPGEPPTPAKEGPPRATARAISTRTSTRRRTASSRSARRRIRAGHQVKVLNLSSYRVVAGRRGRRARSTRTSSACRAGPRTAAAWRSSPS